ncbi:hypothetical protein LSAT2_002323 [Lamellibrachia satsuma]|nr:hypothetical protein LSAT2_002323 [Lamellibrachia satsuma]
MSLVRPKPRHADDVSDAFERLYSASPMSKLLSCESGWGANHSNLSLVSPSPFKHPASVTPVAKIFLQLKKSEGNLSVDSDDRGVDCSRRDSDGFRAFNTDSDSSRYSLEHQQGVEEHDEAVHFSTHSYLLRNSSDAPGQPGYANCEERRGTEAGKDCPISVSPRRIQFQRLNGSVDGNEKLVTGGRGMKCSLRDIEEESDYVGVIGEEERASLDYEENGESLGKMAELGPEENMSCCESEESKESGDETEMRQVLKKKMKGEELKHMEGNLKQKKEVSLKTIQKKERKEVLTETKNLKQQREGSHKKMRNMLNALRVDGPHRHPEVEGNMIQEKVMR